MTVDQRGQKKPLAPLSRNIAGIRVEVAAARTRSPEVVNRRKVALFGAELRGLRDLVGGIELRGVAV